MTTGVDKPSFQEYSIYTRQLPRHLISTANSTTMILRHCWSLPLLLSIFFISHANASVGDRLPEFRRCVEVCKDENCPGTSIRTCLVALMPRLTI